MEVVRRFFLHLLLVKLNTVPDRLVFMDVTLNRDTHNYDVRISNDEADQQLEGTL